MPRTAIIKRDGKAWRVFVTDGRTATRKYREDAVAWCKRRGIRVLGLPQ